MLVFFSRYPVALDTKVLVFDCLHVVRNSRSLLLSSATLPIARLYAAEHVREEVERHLPVLAQRRGLDPARAVAVWRERYLPVINFVSLEGETRDPRVAELVRRDISDKPTGLLAELLAPCLVFSHDGDLVDTGIAEREWVTLSSAGHDVAEMRAVYSGGGLSVAVVGTIGIELGNGAAAACRRWPLPTLLVGAALIYLANRYARSDRARGTWSEFRALASEVGRHVVEISDRSANAQPLLESAAFVPRGVQPLDAKIARIVAIASVPPTAAEVGARVGISRQRAAALLRAPHFVRTDERTYLLGTPGAPPRSVLEQTGTRSDTSS